MSIQLPLLLQNIIQDAVATVGCDGRIITVPPPEELPEDPQPETCSKEKEQQSLNAKTYHVNDEIQATNGVRAKITDIFSDKKSGNGIVCMDFYGATSSEKLNDRTECFAADDFYFASLACDATTFIDYGIKLNYWNPDPENKSVVLALKEDVAGPINNPIDLYNACLQDKTFFAGCLRYIMRTSLPHETIILSNGGATNTIVPSNPSLTAQYVASQHTACQSTVQALLGSKDRQDGYDLAYLRYRPVTETTEMQMGKQMFAGQAFPNNSIVIFASNQLDQTVSENLSKEIIQTPLNPCEAPTILHENCHLVWSLPDQTQYFPSFLQEGAARWFETFAYNPTVVKTPLDIILKNHEFYEVDLDPSGGYDKLRISVQDINQEGAKLVLSYRDPFNNEYYDLEDVNIPANEPFLNYIFGLKFKHVAFNIDQSSGGAKQVHLRGFDANTTSLENAQLTCNNENQTFKVNYGVWFDGKFFKDNGNLLISPKYVPLNEAQYYKDFLSVYYPGACFFEGIHQFYEKSGVDFYAFFRQLTHDIQVQATELTREEQYNNPFCLLDSMQRAINHDLGTKAFDMSAYAASWGIKKEETCHGLDVKAGGWYFGSSILQ